MKKEIGDSFRKIGKLSKRAGLAVVVSGVVLSAVASAARAQTPVNAAVDDPVTRAMKAIETSVQDRVRAADAVLAASRLVNESAAARKQGDRDRAREALGAAEQLAADSREFNRSALIDELARLVATERIAFSPSPELTPAYLEAGRSFAVAMPGSVLARLDQYRETFAQILAEEEVPDGLLGVALVESGFNPLALSPKGARGIWQFMPATARRYGLVVAPGDDHRTHPDHSTRAAARYLRDLYNQFGDWKLALAGYNAGEARVLEVIERTGVRDFDEMARRGYLPAETRKYVPAVLRAWAWLTGTKSLTTANARKGDKARSVEVIPKPKEAAARLKPIQRSSEATARQSQAVKTGATPESDNQNRQ